jgi:hypothetical protein
VSKYPKWLPGSDEQHLLFDLGYSYALLARAKHALSILGDDFEECAELVHDIEEFQAGRLQTTQELYGAAERLFKEVDDAKN